MISVLCKTLVLDAEGQVAETETGKLKTEIGNGRQALPLICSECPSVNLPLKMEVGCYIARDRQVSLQAMVHLVKKSFSYYYSSVLCQQLHTVAI